MLLKKVRKFCFTFTDVVACMVSRVNGTRWGTRTRTRLVLLFMFGNFSHVGYHDPLEDIAN